MDSHEITKNTESTHNSRLKTRREFLGFTVEQVLRLGTAGILSSAAGIEFFINQPRARLATPVISTPTPTGIDDSPKLDTQSSSYIAEAAELPRDETLSSSTLDFLLRGYSSEQRSKMLGLAKEHKKNYVGHGAKGKRLENARNNAVLLNAVVQKLNLKSKLGLTDNEIDSYKAVLFIETESPDDYEGIPDTHGPAQLSHIGALQGAKYLEQNGINLNVAGYTDYVRLHNFDNLSNLSIEENLALGLGMYKWCLDSTPDPTIAALAYNSGLGEINKVWGEKDFRNALEFLSDDEVRTKILTTDSIFNNRARREYPIKQVAAELILMEEKVF